ncbi:MAG TPA: S8 family serine peptidase [Solirubrobacteraceae bacterium]|jgi:subtilisin family serine protease|nr:S8 family serine peptidase [Solirubrobacteraceae bacterium]
MRSTTAALLAAALLALAGTSTAHASWLTAGATSAVQANANKVPAEFGDRLQYALPDGTLRVMVATERRDAQVEDFVAGATTWVKWYGSSARFLARVTPAQLATLLESPVIRFVEPDYPLKPLMSGATLDTHARSLNGAGTGVWTFDPAGGPFGALRPDAAGLTADGATGKGVTTAVIDSGIDNTHKDFGGWDCTPQPYQPCQSRIKHTVVLDHLAGDGFDFQGLPTTELASGHGTHVAGIIAGNGFYTRDGDADPARYGGDGYVFGVAPQSELVSIKNGDTIWAGLSSFGLEWLKDHGAEYGIRAVNNSWGCIGGCSFNGNSATALQIRDLYRAGIVVVFAAGNDAGGPDGAALSGNAQSPYALGVANYDHHNHQLAASSSRGHQASTGTLADPATWTPESEGPNGLRRPDVAAPGTGIWAARTLTGGAASGAPRTNVNDVLGGGSGGFVPYATMSGTSMATPHVVGAAALMFGACPSATPLDVMRAVMAGAVRDRVLKTGSTTAVAEPFEVGYGGLDVRRSLDWLRALPGCSGTVPNQAPTASVTSTDSVRNFEAVTFDGTGSTDRDGQIASYAWDFGDGTTGTGASAQHAYDWPGTYTVSLTVTDDDGATATATRSLAVRDEAAPGKQRVTATRDGVKCSSSAWELALTKAGADAPSSVAVTWADGSRALVGLSSTSGNTATYRTADHLQSALTGAKADVPLGWSGRFEVAAGPFCAKR